MTVRVESPVNSTFIHLEKNAGTSITQWLKQNTVSKRAGKHQTFDSLNKKCQDLGITYTVVRNPFAREVSWYFYMLEKTKKRLKLSEQAYVARSDKRMKKDYDLQKNRELLKYLDKGFANFVLTNNRLSMQNYTAKRCDIVLRQENLHNDFKQIQELYNCKEPLQNYNTSKHYHYSYYYHNKLVRFVYEKYKEDFVFLNYKFQR